MRTSVVATMAAVLGIVNAAQADTYESFGFTGNISPGNANVQAPFTGILTQGQGISGTFLADTSLVPGAGSGLVNVNFFSYPDLAIIPNATLFQINLGGLVIDQGEAVPFSGGVQYNNGNFNGFAFTGDFSFQGNPYEITISGSAFFIDALVNGVPTFQNLVTGTINIGDGNLTDLGAYIPAVAPEPSSLALCGLGLAGLAGVARRKARG